MASAASPSVFFANKRPIPRTLICKDKPCCVFSAVLKKGWTCVYLSTGTARNASCLTHSSGV